jgi:tetratricopeptide (TPR) repeat protein
MKRNLYNILLITTIIIVALIFVFAKKPEPYSEIKERNSSVALQGEWLNTKQAMQSLIHELSLHPTNNQAKLNLVRAYIQEARITGDHAYYDGSALVLLEDIVKSEPNNFEALCCKATVLLSQHHFSDALKVANQARQINPYSAFVYGLLCDAYVELGQYQEAVKMSDQMISIRPDIRSYARVSYLREIFGDYKGAIEACKLAVNSGYPGLEETAWTRMILAHLYLNTGHLDSAEFQYKIALLERPSYAYALAGLGEIEKIKKNNLGAISYFEKANQAIKGQLFGQQLLEQYQAIGNTSKADSIFDLALANYLPENTNENTVQHGHSAEKELAELYLGKNDLNNAWIHATKAFKERPKNIEVCELLAWIYYKRSDLKPAFNLIEEALKTGSKKPQLLVRAGLIYYYHQEKKEGKSLITLAQQTNPYIFDMAFHKEQLPK